MMKLNIQGNLLKRIEFLEAGKANIDADNLTADGKKNIVGLVTPDFTAGVAFSGTITLPCDALVYAYKNGGGIWEGAGFTVNSVLMSNSSAYSSTSCCYAEKGATVVASSGDCQYFPLKGVN